MPSKDEGSASHLNNARHTTHVLYFSFMSYLENVPVTEILK